MRGRNNPLRVNAAQITLLVVLNLFVGGMVGLERTVLPLVARQDFGLLGKSAAVSFIISFAVVKAISNLFAGHIADIIGRKRLLVIGWILAIPIPFIVMFASHWYWVIFANVLLGINQGFCWSMTVNMKIDLASARYRGLVVGLNEFAGYFAIAVTALVSGYIAATYGVRPQPFYLGIAFAAIGLFLSLFAVKNTRPDQMGTHDGTTLSLVQSFVMTSWRNKQLLSVTQAGFMTNFKDGMAWGLFPLFFMSRGLSLPAIAMIVAVYPGTWGILQLISGPVSDRVGRRWLISLGMFVQGLSILEIVFTHNFAWWLAGAIGLGLGTALVYPVLIAAVSDVSDAKWRASTLGVYRFWRDFGYAAGALVSGVLADLAGTANAMWCVGVLSLISGLLVTIVLRESLVQGQSTISA